MMNVTFSILDKEKEKIFENEFLKNKISGLKGHRSVGGYRASIYNAMPIYSIKTLINVMQKVENL